MNEGQCSNLTKLININRKKKKRDLKIQSEKLTGERREKEEEEKRGKLEGKQKRVEGNKFKGKIQVVKCINVYY